MNEGSTPHCGLCPTTLAPLAFTLLSLLACSALAAQADAQERPGAVVLRTQVRDESLASSGRILARVARARLGELDAFRVEGTPDLGLEDLELAVGCMGETSACLGLVAQQLDVDVLLLPAIDRAGQGTVLSLTLFRTHGEPALATVTRQFGGDSDSALVESARSGLAELLGLPAVAATDVTDVMEAADATETAEGHDDSTAGAAMATTETADGPGDGHENAATEATVPGSLFRHRWGWVTAGAGVVGLVLGAGLGLASRRAERAYEDAATDTTAQVDDALSLHVRAQREARAANAFYVLGGLALGTGLVGMLLGLRRPPAAHARLSVVPMIGPRTLALRLTWNLGGVR